TSRSGRTTPSWADWRSMTFDTDSAWPTVPTLVAEATLGSDSAAWVVVVTNGPRTAGTNKSGVERRVEPMVSPREATLAARQQRTRTAAPDRHRRSTAIKGEFRVARARPARQDVHEGGAIRQSVVSF